MAVTLGCVPTFTLGAYRMNLMITGHHLEVTPALRDHVTSKLERVVRHFDQILEVAVVLGVEAPSDKDKRHHAEVNLRLKGHAIHVESVADDLYAAIDTLIDKLDRQVLKHKEKLRDHHHEALKHTSDAL